MRIGMYSKNPKLQKQYSFLEPGNTRTWKVPAGKYGLLAYQYEADIQVVDSGSVEVTVSKNGTFVIPMKLLPVITASARQAWNKLLIDTEATREICATQTVSNSCAQTPATPVTARGFIGLHTDFVQLTPWESIGEQGAVGVFRFDGLRYQVSLHKNDQGTFMGFGRLE